MGVRINARILRQARVDAVSRSLYENMGQYLDILYLVYTLRNSDREKTTFNNRQRGRTFIHLGYSTL